MYKISIYGCAMFKKLVCQWVKWEVITMLNVAHLFGWTITVYENNYWAHIDMSVPSWHEFQNFFFIVGTRLLCLQPLMNSHFHCLIIVELATSQVLFQSPNKLCFVREDCSAYHCSCTHHMSHMLLQLFNWEPLDHPLYCLDSCSNAWALPIPW